MTTVEYDLDTSGGIMEQIQKLVAPPVSEETIKKQRRNTKEYRRHGRAINHDYCDSCQEGGDLLCCDRCPASFHLQCHDPPLMEDDIPPGEWICHRCRMAPKPEIKDDDDASTKSGSSTGHGIRPKPVQMSISPVPMLEEDEDASLNPLQKLAKAARLLNPVQFDLPKDVACTTQMPGSSKRKWWGRDRNMTKKLAHELDNGMVPLPAKLCFVCNKSCRVAPLLQCDYCPLLYHLDCMNPPLTSLPTGRWMCPSHAENLIDEKLLKSISLSDRVCLWDKFSERIQHHSVKINFFKKIHRQFPPFRIKYRHPKRPTLSIPEAVKEFYKNPAPLLPSVSEALAGEPTVRTSEFSSDTTLEEQEEWLKSVVSLQTSVAQYLAQKQLERSGSISDSVKSEIPRIEKPTASVQPVMHRDCSSENNSLLAIDPLGATSTDCASKTCDSLPNGPQNLVPEVHSNGSVDLNKGAVSLLNPPGSTAFVGDVEMTDVYKSKQDEGSRSRSSSLDSPPSNVVKVSWPVGDKQSIASSTLTNKNIVISAVNKSNNTVLTRVVSGTSQGNKGPTCVKNASSGTNTTSILSPRVSFPSGLKIGSSTIIKSGTSSTSGTLSGTKVITVSAPSSGSKTAGLNPGKFGSAAGSQSSAAIIALNNTLQQCLEGTADTELSKLDEKLIHILAWQRLQQLMPKTAGDTTAPRKGMLNGLLTSPGLTSEVQARAVLCPLSGKGQAVPMPYRTLSLGTGADMDVCLTQFGMCHFVSSKHAFIFYDETSKHYELLNYSEHGTTVDNVLYSCDFSEKTCTAPQTSSVVAAVRNMISNNNKTKMKANEMERIKMMGKSGEMKKMCNCKGSSSSLIGGSGAGWEGTALLHHGSYIKVGCIQFVFSIVDHATNCPTPHAGSIKREPMSLLKSQLKATP
ncbi:hypothetical protein CHS0354_006790 [Potamilus streckersoni]|uniref:PHD finger protein 12 n=1 Tax=Potamilus streckersoni TaxID=2493646 RepID=A0AAE0S8F6_9BIVA|nr:hypothetical protein CHS0354_006790 [Potamilus streckersoni]